MAIQDGKVSESCSNLKLSAVFKGNGELTQGPKKAVTSWYEHLMNVLNVPSDHRDEVISRIPSLPPNMDLD